MRIFVPAMLPMFRDQSIMASRRSKRTLPTRNRSRAGLRVAITSQSVATWGIGACRDLASFQSAARFLTREAGLESILTGQGALIPECSRFARGPRNDGIEVVRSATARNRGVSMAQKLSGEARTAALAK